MYISRNTMNMGRFITYLTILTKAMGRSITHNKKPMGRSISHFKKPMGRSDTNHENYGQLLYITETVDRSINHHRKNEGQTH